MRTAECHPDRRYHAKGMCRYCYLKAWVASNTDRVREQARGRTESDAAREKRNARKRNRHFLLEYGLTADDIKRMEDSQGGRCRICHQPPDRGIFGQPPKLHVDHNHATGEVRGMLCSGCNTGIGMLQEDPLRLFASIEYLVVGEVMA